MPDLAHTQLTVLQTLEIELHSLATRKNYQRLDALIHADFLEFGRSGGRYTKADILKALPSEQAPAMIWTDNFDTRYLEKNTALLTYLSAHVLPDGSREKYTFRTSIWQLTEHGWQLRLHQGTPTSTDLTDIVAA